MVAGTVGTYVPNYNIIYVYVRCWHHHLMIILYILPAQLFDQMSPTLKVIGSMTEWNFDLLPSISAMFWVCSSLNSCWQLKQCILYVLWLLLFVLFCMHVCTYYMCIIYIYFSMLDVTSFRQPNCLLPRQVTCLRVGHICGSSVNGQV